MGWPGSDDRREGGGWERGAGRVHSREIEFENRDDKEGEPEQREGVDRDLRMTRMWMWTRMRMREQEREQGAADKYDVIGPGEGAAICTDPEHPVVNAGRGGGEVGRAEWNALHGVVR